MNKYIKIGGSILALGFTLTAIIYRKEIYRGAKKLFGFGLAIPCSGSVLFVGDSTTHYAGGYADMLQKDCGTLKIKKLAKDGKTTAWMLDELKKELASGVKYDAIVINGGLNDIYSGVAIKETTDNLDSMYALAKKSGAKVIAVTPVPSVLYNLYDSKKQAGHDTINAFIRNSDKTDYVADWYNLMGGSKPDKKLVGPDGLHPTVSGYEVLKDDLKKEFKK